MSDKDEQDISQDTPDVEGHKRVALTDADVAPETDEETPDFEGHHKARPAPAVERRF
jgi:hypothetical protein